MAQRFRALGALALVLALSCAGGAAYASTYKVIHTFAGDETDGAYPVGNLILGTDGNLYGTTQTNVFRLSPPGVGETQWTETFLHRFAFLGSAGDYALGGLVMDGNGALYGPGYGGSRDKGVIFKITPPAPGRSEWTATGIYTFGTDFYYDGSQPEGALTLDANGALYGTTHYGGQHNSGTVFKLTPPTSPTGQWTETILHNFKGGTDGCRPTTGVFLDGAGNVYGNSSYCSKNGIAFELSPPATGDSYWSFRSIYRAENVFAITMDAAGDIYGVSTRPPSGQFSLLSMFKLTKPVSGTVWHPTQLYTFGASPPDADSPSGGPTIGTDGHLYFTSSYGGLYNDGAVFKLSRPRLGGIWKETRLYSFSHLAYENGFNPAGGVVIDAKGNIFGTTFSGGDKDRHGKTFGVVYEISP